MWQKLLKLFSVNKIVQAAQFVIMLKEVIVAAFFILALYLLIKLIRTLLKKPPRIPTISYYLGDDIMDKYYEKVSSAIVTLHELPNMPVIEDASNNIVEPRETLRQLSEEIELQALKSAFNDKSALEKNIRDMFHDEPYKRIKTNQLFQDIQQKTVSKA